MSERAIAIYDLDRTVTRRPTYTHFLLHAARRIAPWRLLLAPLLLPAMAGHVIGLYDRDRLKPMMWRLLLGRVRREALDPAIASFVGWTLAANIRPGARRQIAADRARGALLVLASAAQDLYARPIAEALGFDEVLATRMNVADDGHIEPALAGGNVYAAAKLAAVEGLLAERGIARSEARISFHSDSSSDRPVFIWCDAPVAVAPSRRLIRMARKEGWSIVDWD